MTAFAPFYRSSIGKKMIVALTGVILMLLITGTTLNIQSFMGAIMAIGVAVANAILLVVFAERYRREGSSPKDAFKR